MLFAGSCFGLFRSLARRFRQIADRSRRGGVQIAEDRLDVRRECQLGVQLGPIQLASGNLVLTQDGKRRLHPALVSIKKPQAMAALRRRGKINDDGALVWKSGENLYPASAPKPAKTNAGAAGNEAFYSAQPLLSTHGLQIFVDDLVRRRLVAWYQDIVLLFAESSIHVGQSRRGKRAITTAMAAPAGHFLVSEEVVAVDGLDHPHHPARRDLSQRILSPIHFL